MALIDMVLWAMVAISIPLTIILWSFCIFIFKEWSR